jgi:hypothetical protein
MSLKGVDAEVALAGEFDTTRWARERLGAWLAERADVLCRLMELHVARVPETHGVFAYLAAECVSSSASATGERKRGAGSDT